MPTHHKSLCKRLSRPAWPPRANRNSAWRGRTPGCLVALLALALPLHADAAAVIQIADSTARLTGFNAYYVGASDQGALTLLLTATDVRASAVDPGVVTRSSLVGSQQKEVDQRPTGGGLYRIVQQHDTTMSQSYTLDTANPGVNQITGAGLTRADLVWTLQDGFGQHLPGSQVLPTIDNLQSLRFDLQQAVDVRLSGRTDSSGDLLRSFLEFHVCPQGQVCQALDDFLVDEASTVDRSFEFVGHLEPGTYLVQAHTITKGLRSSATDLNLFGSWDYTLEFSASPVPEPGSQSLLVAGLLAMAGRRRIAARGGCCG